VGRTSGSHETIYFIPTKTSSTSLTPLPIDIGIGRGWGRSGIKKNEKGGSDLSDGFTLSEAVA